MPKLSLISVQAILDEEIEEDEISDGLIHETPIDIDEPYEYDKELDDDYFYSCCDSSSFLNWDFYD